MRKIQNYLSILFVITVIFISLLVSGKGQNKHIGWAPYSTLQTGIIFILAKINGL